MYSKYGEPIIEPRNGKFVSKEYDIDEYDYKELCSIDILNGTYAGQNILEYNFSNTNYDNIRGKSMVLYTDFI